MWLATLTRAAAPPDLWTAALHVSSRLWFFISLRLCAKCTLMFHAKSRRTERSKPQSWRTKGLLLFQKEKGVSSCIQSFVVNLNAMKRKTSSSLVTLALVLLCFTLTKPIGAQRTAQPAQRKTLNRSARDEALWQKALGIHRRAIV